MPEATLGEIAAHLGGELIGDAGARIDRISPLESATPSSISFLSNPRFVHQLASTQAACVIVGPALREVAAARGAVLVVPDAYLGFARLTQWWAARGRPAAAAGIHPSAVVDSTAALAANVSIGPFVVIEAGVSIAEGAVIGAHCFVGAAASIGSGTRFAARVTLAHGCHIGGRGIVHSGAVIGADGFGFAASPEGAVKIEQLGGVRIGDDVEIGANTCIDRGALEDTVLEDGVKIDNLVQIGHNVRIGKHSAVAGCAGVAGSTIIGSRCIIGGAAMVMGHLTLADGVIISAGSAVTRSILKPGTYTGFFPIDDNAAWEKNAATLRGLHAMRERLRALEKKTS
ncbi:MAG TPA: UDP-3-O-(3-hydroxymyristoyl)glucosamine N-acyltransferase [Rhizobacter sp.]|nr:UDP-3-O-(3-hydroxymyristoyl)glucosamine N-acyltransferase [Rhizobacter sp.]